MFDDDIAGWPHAADAVRPSDAGAESGRELTIALHGRLHLTDKDRVLDTAPSFAYLSGEMLKRVQRVAGRWGSLPPVSPQTEHDLLALANKVELAEWTPARGIRSSKVKKTLDPKKGRKQEIRYERGRIGGAMRYRAPAPADWIPLLPWIRACRTLQVGGQTTMGAGGFEFGFSRHVDVETMDSRDARTAEVKRGP